MTTPFINRPPRFQPNLPHNQVEIPQPPNLPNDTQQTLLQLALPLISIIGYVLVSMLGQSRNPVFLIPMALSVMVSVGMSIYTRRKSRAEVARQKNAYREQIVELRRDMGVAHEAQRHFYHHNFPSHEQAMAIADQANGRSLGKTHDEGIATRIWERRTSDVDFGSVRIGTGLVASTVLYALRQGGSLEDELVRGAMRLAEDSLYVHETPIVMQLRPKPDTPPTVQFAATQHAVAIVGANRGRVYEHTNALLTHFSTFHSPTDTELLILGSDKARRQWLWATELPHCSGGRNRSYCFESDRAQAQMQVERVDSFLKNLANVLGERHSRLLDRDYAADVTLPFMLVVVDLLHEASSESRLAHIESDAAIGMLIHRGHELGAAVLFLVPNQHAIPSGCHGALVISESERGYEVERNVSFRYIETGVNTPRFSGKLDLVTDRNPLQAFANHLKPLRVPRSAGAALPNGVLMLDMLGLSTAADFRQAMQQQWQQSILADEADWLKCSLGLSQSGETRTLKYAADADGVHGMVAGSTGSGKSELLMTMILDMAYRYDPSIINFVLVDFKGGGAFKPLEGLPHVVDVVTNLSESAVERMFAAVTAELNRRQAINTNTESKDIVAYRKRGLHESVGLYRVLK